MNGAKTVSENLGERNTKLFWAEHHLRTVWQLPEDSYLRRRHQNPSTLSIWCFPLLPVPELLLFYLQPSYLPHKFFQWTKLEMLLAKFMDYTDCRTDNTLSHHLVPDQRNLSKCYHYSAWSRPHLGLKRIGPSISLCHCIWVFLSLLHLESIKSILRVLQNE